MITRFRAQNFKALRDVTLELTPLHVLIGPNDSGKTSLLEAIAALCRSVDHPISDAFIGSWDGTELVSSRGSDSTVRLSADVSDELGAFTYDLFVHFGDKGKSAEVAREVFRSEGSQVMGPLHSGSMSPNITIADGAGVEQLEFLSECRRRLAALRSVALLHWTARNLGLPSALNPGRGYRLETSGFGLASLLDSILSEDRLRFDALERKLKSIFPQVEALQIPQSPAYDAPVDEATTVLKLTNATGKSVRFRFKGHEKPVPASQASDGLLYVLGYLALLYSPEPPRILLVEEPENGIHPNRLREILAILRQLIAEHPGTQVVMTTHSPYVIDEFSPDEVTLCQREEDGTVSVKRLSESETVRRQLDLFTLGEIWTAEGDETIAADPEEVQQP